MKFNIIAELVKTEACRFASITYTAKGTGETARHNLLLNVSTEGLYQKSLRILRAKKRFLSGVALEACQELIASMEESLQKGIGQNSAYTLKDTLVPVANGIKLNTHDGSLLVTAFSRGKVVLTPGTHKKVNSSEKTLAKKALERTLPKSRIRTFCLSAAQLESARLNGKTLEFA